MICFIKLKNNPAESQKLGVNRTPGCTPSGPADLIFPAPPHLTAGNRHAGRRSRGGLSVL